MLKYYGVSLKNGNEIILNKYKSGGNTIEPLQKVKVDSYNDGSMHELRIRVMDKDYEVLWDGESVIKRLRYQRTYNLWEYRFEIHGL